MAQYRFTLRSELAVQAQSFWDAQSLATVNTELAPLARMTAPAALLRTPIVQFTPALLPLHSWILLGGLIPVDRHRFGSFDFPAQTTFVELSTSVLNRHWRHERTVTSSATGCTVQDTVTLEPRLGIFGPVQKFLTHLVFQRRHANLRKRHAVVRG